MTAVNIFGIISIFIGHIFWIPNLSENKFGKIKTGLIYFGLFILSTCICIIFGEFIIKDFDKAISCMFIVTCILFFIFYLVLSNGIFLKKLFLFITYVNFFCVVHNLSYLLTKFIFNDKEVFYGPIPILIRIFLQFGGLLFYLYFLKGKVQVTEVTDKKQWLPICTAGLLFFCLHVVWTAVGTNVWNYTATDTIVFVLLFVVTIGLYIVIFYTINCMNTISQISLIEQQSKYLQEQVKNYKSSEASNSRLRHDVRHHLLSIYAFVQNGDQQAALDYIKEYDNKILDLTPTRYSNNNAINNIISAYAVKFNETKIPFNIHCGISETISINDVDLISLLGNLLENALHGCKECEGDKRADIYLRLQNKKLIVVCENTCSSELELVDGLPKRKSVGVSSMLAVCHKYNGHLGYSINKGICSACAVLNL